MNRFVSAMALLLIAFAVKPARAQKAGDTVIVLRETPVKRDGSPLTIQPGVVVDVCDVGEEWVLISAETTGSIAKRDVATPERAIEIFLEQIDKNPTNAAAYVARGNAKLEKDDFDEAIEIE
jgi:hypothetical protein